METKCIFCNPFAEQILKANSSARILIPIRLHIAPEDGGHLIVAPLRHVRNRLEINEVEAKEIWKLSIHAAKLLELLLNIDWYNFQENGNWTVDDPQACHMHLHVYGRSRISEKQPFKEALRFPLKREWSDWKDSKYSDSMIGFLHEAVKKLKD
jgi:diadenosine tetraphosphate (Ap4A) HIT family hydrolase